MSAPNKYAKNCFLCGKPVPPYAGYLFHLEGRVKTRCRDCQYYPPPPVNVPSSHEVACWMQATLNLLHYKPKLAVDGSYGPKTKDAVAAYQLDNELAMVTGLPTAETVRHMLKEIDDWNTRRKN